MDLTKNEVTHRCKDLVYKVAYAFYDSPYIIMLRVLVNQSVYVVFAAKAEIRGLI